jgi:hypothetical protein
MRRALAELGFALARTLGFGLHEWLAGGVTHITL